MKISIKLIPFSIACLLTQLTYASGFSIIDTEIVKTLSSHSLILLSIIGVGAYTTFFGKYVKKSFVDLETYRKHRTFWVSISVLTLIFIWILITKKPCHSIGKCVDNNFVIFAIIWMSYLLTTTLGPAIYQNPSNKGITGLALLFSNIILIALFVLYLKDIEITKSYQPMTLVITSIPVFTALAILLGYFQLLQNIVKEALFTIAICLDVLWLLLVVMAFVFLIKSG